MHYVAKCLGCGDLYIPGDEYFCKECLKEHKEVYRKWYEWQKTRVEGEVLPE